MLNDDSMDKKYAWKKTPPKNGEQELSVAGQPEHGQSDRKPKYTQEYQEVQQANQDPLQCRNVQDRPRR